MKNNFYSKKEIGVILVISLMFYIEGTFLERIIPKILGNGGLLIEHLVTTLFFPLLLMFFFLFLKGNINKNNFKKISIFFGLTILVFSLVLDFKDLITKVDYNQIWQIIGDIFGAFFFFIIQRQKWK